MEEGDWKVGERWPQKKFHKIRSGRNSMVQEGGREGTLNSHVVEEEKGSLEQVEGSEDCKNREVDGKFLI